MKHTPSWYEHVEGRREVPLPVQPKDIVEFTDETVEVKALTLDELTPAQREAYERAFK